MAEGDDTISRAVVLGEAGYQLASHRRRRRSARALHHSRPGAAGHPGPPLRGDRSVAPRERSPKRSKRDAGIESLRIIGAAPGSLAQWGRCCASFFVAPPSRRLSGGRPARPQAQDALATAGKMPALLSLTPSQFLPYQIFHIRRQSRSLENFAHLCRRTLSLRADLLPRLMFAYLCF